MKKILGLIVLVLVLAACGSSSAPLDTIEGTWRGPITSNVHDESETLTLTVGPETGAGNHEASLSGLTVFCEGSSTRMECYRFTTSSSIQMDGNISGRTWSGSFTFSDPTFGYDSGTFRMTKQ